MDILSPGQYKDNTTLSEIELGSFIQTIPRECFQGCRNLKRIIIPRTVKRIDFKAFANSGLQEVVFEENSCLRVISARSFEMCYDLTTITLPPTLCIIGSYSFHQCPKLGTTIQISIPRNVQDIGAFAFSQSGIVHLEICCGSNSSEFSDKIVDQERLITLNIGFGSFKSCSKLQSLNLSPYPRMEGSMKSMSNQITLQTAESQFKSQPQPTTTTLLLHTFTDYKSVYIGSHAFAFCWHLELMTISSSLKSIGTYAFSCSNLEKITFLPDLLFEPISEENSRFNSDRFDNDRFPTSLNSIGNYAFFGSKINDESFATIFSNYHITCIGFKAFAESQNLRSIEISPSITSIGASAFMKSSIKSANFSPDSDLLAIPCEMFSFCKNLKFISIPSSVIWIQEKAFFSTAIDESIGTILPGSNVQHIATRAFFNCNNLKSITFPSSIRSLGRSIFSPRHIENVMFSESSQLEAIPAYMFSNSHNLKVVTLSQSIKSLGDFAFYDSAINDHIFATIFTNDNIEHIGNYAFSSCKNLVSISIPSSVTSIGTHIFQSSSIATVEFSMGSQVYALPTFTFSDCYQLKHVTLPPSIKSIGAFAFSQSGINYHAFINIFANCDIQHIGMKAFVGCDLELCEYPSSVKSIDKSAFDDTQLCPRSTYSRCVIN